jgi:hypothetical protein
MGNDSQTRAARAVHQVNAQQRKAREAAVQKLAPGPEPESDDCPNKARYIRELLAKKRLQRLV